MTARCPDGHSIAYDQRGEGLPVLFVHGFPHDRTLWAPQLRTIGESARCIALDLRGFGESGRSGPFGMDQYADDLACLLDHLSIDRAVLCGLSMGGYVSFAFWRRHRERVRALVLCDTKAGADSEEAATKRHTQMALAREQGAAAVADQVIEGMLGKSTRARSPETVATVRRMLERAPVEGIVGALEAMIARPDSTPDLATIDVPTLVVVGDEDTLTPPKEARALHEGIAGSRLEILAGAGHVSNVERPSSFDHVLVDFLASLGEG